MKTHSHRQTHDIVLVFPSANISSTMHLCCVSNDICPPLQTKEICDVCGHDEAYFATYQVTNSYLVCIIAYDAHPNDLSACVCMSCFQPVCTVVSLRILSYVRGQVALAPMT